LWSNTYIKIGKIRKENLKKLEIEINYKIPDDTNFVFCGGKFNNLSRILRKS